MTVHDVTIAMNGVSGRMGTNQHLTRSILAIRREGGVALANGDRIWPEPILLGRNEGKLRNLAKEHGLDRWSTNLDEVLADPGVGVYFDSQLTGLRPDGVRRAIDAGKHIYCEKPLAEDVASALQLAERARERGTKNGIVQDKLFLPGLLKLKRVIDSGFLGRILRVQCEFGYWVFEGYLEPPQRPSWNYRKADGGGIVLDMFPHWEYVLSNLFAPVRSVLCSAVTHIDERVDEHGQPYEATADDAAYAILQLDGGIVAQINSSWATRVYRDDLVVFQVDGTDGSAVAGLRDCKVQHRVNTPRPVWNPDVPNPHNFRDGWIDVSDTREYDNGFKVQWELFLRHVVLDEPFPWDFFAAVRGSQLAEAALESAGRRCWVDLPETVR